MVVAAVMVTATMPVADWPQGGSAAGFLEGTWARAGIILSEECVIYLTNLD